MEYLQENCVTGNIIIEAFNKLDEFEKNLYCKYEHMNNILYDYIFYRIRKFDKYKKKIFHRIDILRQRILKKIQTNYAKN